MTFLIDKRVSCNNLCKIFPHTSQVQVDHSAVEALGGLRELRDLRLEMVRHGDGGTVLCDLSHVTHPYPM